MRRRARRDPNFHFQYRPEHIALMEEQLWQAREHGLAVVDRFSRFEYDQVAAFIGEPETVLDLGCGLGRASIYLNAALGLVGTHFILADSTGDRCQTWDASYVGFGERVYNDLERTASFCGLNGLKDFRIFDYLTGDWGSLPPVDLAISHCAAGMHFPIAEVMPHLLEVAGDTITMIFGTRNRDVYHEGSFSDLFHRVWFLRQEEVPPFPQQDWLILRHKKR